MELGCGLKEREMELRCGSSAEARGRVKHWLVLKEEQNDGKYRTKCCVVCKETVESGPRLGCSQCEDIYHDGCVFSALPDQEIVHPFHHEHSLYLCDQMHFDATELKFVKIHHEDHIHPLVLIENHSYKPEQAVCYCCSEPLVDSIFVCIDCKFYLHKNCVSPVKISHPCHRKHSLLLHVAAAFEPVFCKVCQRTESRQLFYRCSPCNFNLHTECVSPSPFVDNASHEHPFTCLLRHQSFICDACGTQGDCAPYHCHTCNLLVHKECISLPRRFKITRHHHLLYHTYFLEEHEFKKWDCKICHNEVNAEHGSYNCSLCNYVVHVNCANDVADLDGLIMTRSKDKRPCKNSAFLFDESISFIVIKEVEFEGHKIAKEIRHFSHVHDLALTGEIGDDKRCDGCMLSISTSSYGCSLCDFFLHKSCAELPREKHHWLHEHPFKLSSDTIFKCNWCHHESSGLSYYCGKCDMNLCLRCERISEEYTIQAHEHPLVFYHNYDGECNACGDHIDYAFKCKDCDFALDIQCLSLPYSKQHKCDQHPLILTYHDSNDALSNCYCDICEEERDSNRWFYRCAICNTSVHPKCVLEKYQFIKLGSYYRDEHPHLLTFVQKIYYYPKCFKCDKPCLDLALECIEFGCKYVVHWECIKPSRLCFTGKMGRKREDGNQEED
ncbi:PREDICTED: uncharacterized protein LOC18600247 [Theobroma cacao]|uniref:Uncharacterized protein LOC18600247 n=1 Tax=Theobroma cacao TaxID=3641 RepID=A0AB32WAT5_THECC|nr:PREDICTED: uncharacterized protein LOC18600247 [Theobroma cacao]